MAEALTLALFQDLDQKTCQVRVGDDFLQLTLDAVVPKERQPPGYECFTLIFKGPRHSPLQQAIYQLDFSEDQSFPLFLVPVDAADDFVEYEAVFSRRLTKD